MFVVYYVCGLFITLAAITGLKTNSCKQHFQDAEVSAEITGENSAHFGQFVEFDRLLEQALVLGLLSHFTDDSSGVPSKLIYDSRLERGGETRVRQSTVVTGHLPLSGPTTLS